MQSVAAAFTAEERDRTRSIAQSLLVSWKKQTNLNKRTFTIGVSLIGGNDIIGVNPGAVGGPGIYTYFDESDYLLSLAWERGLNMPMGGLATGMAEARLDNTSGRFTSRYMGGSSELFTAILPRRPMLISAGFNMGGTDQTMPQFAGILSKKPSLDIRSRVLSVQAADYTDFFSNRFLDQEVMFTSQRTDQVLETAFQSLGMSTGQYELDTGINVVPFGLFEKGTRWADHINQLVQAENGHLYQDEQGKFRFENRQHWDSSPYNSVQRILLTGQVIDAYDPDDDHIINVVEINANIRAKQPEQVIFRLSPFDTIAVPASGTVEAFVDFDNPALSMTTPTSSGSLSYFVANDAEDGSGTDVTTSLTVSRVDKFAKAAKVIFSNSSTAVAYITTLVITGRPAAVERQLYYRDAAGASVTAYEERVYQIDNDYIQSESWANSLAQMILSDYSRPENLQRLTIRAIPELQLGDLVSWQGRYWRIFDIKANLDANGGFIQDLTLLQRTVRSYFRIGISTVGGSDMIAP